MINLDFKQILSILLFSIPSTILNIGILYSINLAVIGASIFEIKYILFFFSLLVYSFVLHRLFQEKIIYISNELIYKNEIHIISTINKARLIDFQQMGKEKVYGILEDLRNLVFIPYVLTNGLNSFIILLVGVAYLFFLSIKAAFVQDIIGKIKKAKTDEIIKNLKISMIVLTMISMLLGRVNT